MQVQRDALLREMQPTHTHLRNQLFSAIRDSLFYPTKPGENANRNTRNRMNYEYRKATREREEAREWFRDKAMSHDENGYGFGWLWESLQNLGSAGVHIDTFVDGLESLWARADRDPGYGKRTIRLLQDILSEGSTHPAQISRMKKKLHTRRVA